MQVIKGICIEGSDQRQIATDVFFLNNNKKKTIVIYLHGFNGFKDWGNFDLIASQFAEAGYFFCKFNFSHNGTTPDYPEEFIDLEAYGKNTYSYEINDTLHIVEWLQDKNNPYFQHYDPANIILLGHSRGGGIAILSAAGQKAIKGLITWASVSECKTPWSKWPTEKMTLWKETGVQYYENKRTMQQLPLYYTLYEDYYLHETELNIQKAISNLQIPILICHGTLDEAVPFESANRLHSWANQSTLLSLETDHVFGRKHPNTENNIPQPTQIVVKKSIEFIKEIKF